MALQRRVVVLGAGFGGMYTAHHLERLSAASQGIQVTLISRDNYLLMTPLLFEAGSGVLEPRHAVNPLRPLFKRTRFMEGEVQSIDFDKRCVRLIIAEDQAAEIPYDHLVIALGGITNRAIIPGSHNAMAFKTLADAIHVRNHTIDLFERADVEEDPLRKQALLTFVIVGAGLVGTELMGEFTEFTRNLARSYPRVKHKEIRFELIEAGPMVMPEMDRSLADYGVEVLKRRGVNVRVNSPVKAIEPGSVVLPDGSRIRAATVVLAAGVAVNPLLAAMPVAKDRKGRIAVSADLRCISHPEVWALGDCASIPDPSGKPYPQLAQHAMREALVLAQNLISVMQGQPTRPFIYKTLGTLAALGHYQGIGRIWKFKLRGFLAWWVWRSYYLMQMPRFDRRLRIMLDWTVALLFRPDIAKLDLFTEEHLRSRANRFVPTREGEESQTQAPAEPSRQLR